MSQPLSAFVVSLAVLVAGLAGCGGSDAAEVTVGERLELAVVGGSAACDSCTTLTVRVTGRGVQEVVAADIVAPDAARTTVGAFTSVRTVTDGATPELEVAATFRDVPAPGTYDLLLRTDREGADSVVRLRGALTVTATSRGGAVQVRVRATGVDIGAGFRVVADSGCTPVACPPLDAPPNTLARRSLTPGSYVLRLDGVAPNCSVGSPNPVRATVVRGQLTALAFEVSCRALANPAWARLLVSVSGTGTIRDSVGVRCTTIGCKTEWLAGGVPRLVPFYPLANGFQLLGLPRNCRLAGENPRRVQGVSDDTIPVVFAVACSDGRTTIVTRTRGADPDSSYDLRFCIRLSEGSDGCARAESFTMGANDTLVVDASDGFLAGAYAHLDDVAQNCILGASGGQWAQVSFVPGEPVVFDVECGPPTLALITVAASGARVPARFNIAGDGDCDFGMLDPRFCSTWSVAPGELSRLKIRPGYQVFWVLEGANGVCVMISPDRDFQFTADPGSVTELRFELRCD